MPTGSFLYSPAFFHVRPLVSVLADPLSCQLTHFHARHSFSCAGLLVFMPATHFLTCPLAFTHTNLVICSHPHSQPPHSCTHSFSLTACTHLHPPALQGLFTLSVDLHPYKFVFAHTRLFLLIRVCFLSFAFAFGRMRLFLLVRIHFHLCACG